MSTTSERNAVARAQTLIDLRRFKEAVDILRHAAASDPGDPKPKHLLAFALLQSDKPAQALEVAEASIAVAPDHEWGHRLRALALGQLGRLKQAHEAADHATALAPELAQSHTVRAQVLEQRGRVREAEEAARRAVELAPEDPDTHQVLSDVLLRKGDLKGAEGALRTALKLDPQDAAAHNNLGVVLLRQEKEAWAMRAFERAAQIDPRQDVSRRNIINTARNRSFEWFPVGLLIYGTFKLMSYTGDRGSPLLGLVIALGAWWLVGSVFYYVNQRAEEGSQPPITRALLADERARKRRRPWTWRPAYVPLPLQLLHVLPSPLTASLGLAVVVLMLFDSSGFERADWIVLGFVAALTAVPAVGTHAFARRKGWV